MTEDSTRTSSNLYDHEIYERLRPIRFVGISGRRAAGPATPRNINRRHEFARGVPRTDVD